MKKLQLVITSTSLIHHLDLLPWNELFLSFMFCIAYPYMLIFFLMLIILVGLQAVHRGPKHLSQQFLATLTR